MTNRPPCPDIYHLPCYRTREPITIDGRLDEAAWQKAPRSPRFVDMTSGEPGWYDTRVAAMWDAGYLYVGFWIEEPFVEAHHTRRDAIIFQENDVEVFIDGGDCYYELEINARNTVYEVFFIWRDAFTRGSRFDRPEFDLYTHQVYSFGGDYDRRPASFWDGTHPRGTRWAFRDWDLPGLRTAVHVDGTLNDPGDIDRGWTVELAFPWQSLALLAGNRPLPPHPGDEWRLFFGRFQRFSAGGAEVNPHPAWVVSPHGMPDTHQPHCFPYVEFLDQAVEDR